MDDKYFARDRGAIRANPSITTLRTQRFWFLFFGVSLLALLVLRFVIEALFGDNHSSSTNSILYAYTSLLVLYAFGLVMSFLQERYWRRIEKLRFAAANGDRTLLADEQPVPDAFALSLPTTIRLQPSKWLVLQMLGWTGVLVLLIVGAFNLFRNAFVTFTATNFQAFLVFFSLSVALIWSIFFVFILVYRRQKIEITEQGLSVNYFGGHGKIKWDEARLFARYPTFGDRKSKRTITYELSSTTDIIRWTWIQSKLFFPSMEPAIPLAEYHQQMQALFSLVAARTGLPLHNLTSNPG